MWLSDAMERVSGSDDPENDLLNHSAMARRKLGSEKLGEKPGVIDTPHGRLQIDHWEAGDGGRTLLLLTACHAFPDRCRHWFESLFRHGDEMERSAVVRALVLFPEPALLEQIALEAGRANSLMLYAALALKNPYPAAFYEDPAFNQVVLKSLFTGLPVEQIQGLPQRANSVLSHMCEDYADERMAAGRTVPSDIWLAIAPHASDHGKDLLLQFLDHEELRHRYYATLAMGRRISEVPEFAVALRQRLAVESEPVIRKALEQQLAD